MPVTRADWIKLMIAAARLPLRRDPANNLKVCSVDAYAEAVFENFKHVQKVPKLHKAGFDGEIST